MYAFFDKLVDLIYITIFLQNPILVFLEGEDSIFVSLGMDEVWLAQILLSITHQTGDAVLTRVEEGVIRQRHSVHRVQTDTFTVANVFKMTNPHH